MVDGISMLNWISKSPATLVFSMSICLLASGVPAQESGFMSKAPDEPAAPLCRVLLTLKPNEGTPRHSEGDLLRRRDGALLAVWTRFTSGTGGDHDPADLVASVSADGGVTWSRPRVVVPSEGGMNVMSVTLRRLADGRIALFHLIKHSLVNCRPVVRFSSDEGATWSEPTEIVPPEDVGYDVLNNDRVYIDETGRMLVPVARHAGSGMTPRFSAAARLRCYVSEDHGATWNSGGWAPEVSGVVLQEPGIFQAADGTLRMHARTNGGCHYIASSGDRGRTFSRPRPWTLRSPMSPATVERLDDGDLLALWNEPASDVKAASSPRTPLVAARSSDDGATWGARSVLFDHPDGWYCYVAHLPSEAGMYLMTCAGDRSNGNGLETTVVLEAPLPPRDP